MNYAPRRDLAAGMRTPALIWLNRDRGLLDCFDAGRHDPQWCRWHADCRVDSCKYRGDLTKSE